MPFWVWLAFAEVPALRVLVGGALVMGAVIADIIGDSRRSDQQLSDHSVELRRISTQIRFLAHRVLLGFVGLPVPCRCA